MLGGEARQNEFSVAGERLLGPQGSNDFAVPAAGSGSLADAFFTEFALPREYSWQSWDARLKPLRFARDNYSNMDGFQESQVDVGHFFGAGPDGKPLWRRNIWSNGLKDAPFSEIARRDLLRWRADNGPVSEAQDRSRFRRRVCPGPGVSRESTCPERERAELRHPPGAGVASPQYACPRLP